MSDDLFQWEEISRKCGGLRKSSKNDEWTPQDLCGHDEASGGGVDLDVAGDEADVGESVPEITELLVAQGLEHRITVEFGGLFEWFVSSIS